MFDEGFFVRSKRKIVKRYNIDPKKLEDKIREFCSASTFNDINLVSTFTRFKENDRKVNEEDAIVTLIGITHLEAIYKKLNIGFLKKLFMSRDDRTTINRCYYVIAEALLNATDDEGCVNEDTLIFYENWSNVYNMSQTVIE